MKPHQHISVQNIKWAESLNCKIPTAVHFIVPLSVLALEIKDV
jgi:hypothetical protein